MMLRFFAAAILASLLCIGCQAYRHCLAVASADRLSLPEAGLHDLVVGVRRPILEDWPGWRELDSEFRSRLATSEAQTLIDRLDRTSYFRQVAFEDKLSELPDLVITPVEGPPPEGVDGQNFMVTFFTLGVVPVWERWQQGVYFRRVDISGPQFQCDWPMDVWVGIIAYPLLVSKSWHFQPDQEAFDYHLKQCINEQKQVFGHSMKPPSRAGRPTPRSSGRASHAAERERWAT